MTEFQTQSSPNADWLTHLAGAAGTVAIALSLYYFLYSPAVTETELNLARALTLQGELAGADEIRSEFRVLNNTLADVGPLKKWDQKEIPTRPFDTQFLGDVSAIAESLRITVDDFQRGKISESKLFSKLNINVHFQSDYASICQFFHQVSQLPHLTQIRKLEINSESTEGVYAVSVEFALCFRPENSDLAPAVALR